MNVLKVYSSSERGLKDALTVVHIFSLDIGMTYGLEKCAMLHLKRGRTMAISVDVNLANGSIICHLGADEPYIVHSLSRYFSTGCLKAASIKAYSAGNKKLSFGSRDPSCP